jgi:hypothetical protein
MHQTAWFKNQEARNNSTQENVHDREDDVTAQERKVLNQ